VPRGNHPWMCVLGRAAGGVLRAETAAHRPRSTNRPSPARKEQGGGRPCCFRLGFDTLSFSALRSETGASEPPKGSAVIAASWSVPLRARQSLRCGRACGWVSLRILAFGLAWGTRPFGPVPGRSSGRRSLRTVSPGAFFPGDPRARRPASVAVDVMSRPPDRRPGNARNTPFRGQVGSIGGKVFAFCGNPGENFQHPENTPGIAAKKSRRNSHCTGFCSLYAVALQAAAASLVPKRP
jgi:hypothetical protein